MPSHENWHGAVVSLVLTVLFTVACTHMVFAKATLVAPTEFELAFSGTRRTQHETPPLPSERAAGTSWITRLGVCLDVLLDARP